MVFWSVDLSNNFNWSKYIHPQKEINSLVHQEDGLGYSRVRQQTTCDLLLYLLPHHCKKACIQPVRSKRMGHDNNVHQSEEFLGLEETFIV